MLLDLVHEWAGIMNDERRAADGGDQGEPAEDLFRVERPDDERQRRVLPHPGSDAGHRIRARSGTSTHIHTIYRDPTNDYGVKLLK